MLLPVALIGKLAIGLILVFILALIDLFSLLFRR